MRSLTLRVALAMTARTGLYRIRLTTEGSLPGP